MGKACWPRAQPGQVPPNRKGALCSAGAQREIRPKGTAGPDGFTDMLWLWEWMLLAVEKSFIRTPIRCRMENGFGRAKLGGEAKHYQAFTTVHQRSF